MTIPKKIYLQIVDDAGNVLDPMKDEVTWCWDKINDNDVEYTLVKETCDCGELFPESGYCRYCGAYQRKSE